MKETLIEKNLAKARGSLTVTHYLIKKGRFEFAVNRAYYTMFHSVQALLFAKNIRVKSFRKTHIAFNRELVLTGELPLGLGGILKRTLKKSLRADYNYVEVKEADAIEAFTDAEFFLMQPYII